MNPYSVEVIVLHNGYSKLVENGSRANCTCTLIKGKPNVIVDTMTAWDGEKIEKALSKQALTCDQIEWVVCTHGHSDHVGCNYLFSQATHIVGHDISTKDFYYNFDFTTEREFKISDRIKVIATPGHTLQDVSVIVETESKGIIAITGDLFENETDVTDESIWKSAGSQNEELQRKNRGMVIGMVDWIVPGHGSMFCVDDSIKKSFVNNK